MMAHRKRPWLLAGLLIWVGFNGKTATAFAAPMTTLPAASSPALHDPNIPPGEAAPDDTIPPNPTEAAQLSPTYRVTAGPLSGLGTTLADHGVYINLRDVAQYQAVTAGGINHGSFGTNWAIFGVDLDLQQIIGLKGAAIRLSLNDVSGQGRQYQFTGATWSSLNNWAAPDGIRVRAFAWDQRLFDDTLQLLAGRYNASADGFDTSELYCRFATFLCSTPRMFRANAAAPTFQESSWMARVAYKPTNALYAKVAVLEEEPWLRANNHNGWPGPDWGLNHAQGAFIPIEAGYKTTFANDLYPREYVLGATYDSIQYADPYYNRIGESIARFKGAAQNHSGRSTIYIQAQQTLWRPNFDQDRGLIVFGDANFVTTGYGVMRDGFDLGLFDWGPFDVRPRDSIAIVMEMHLWNHRTMQNFDAISAATGVNTSMSGNETMMEINYGASIIPGAIFTPYMEYIWHPDQLSLATPRRDLNHAAQIGAILSLNFNQLFGLPILQRLR